MKINSRLPDLICCPICKAKLDLTNDNYVVCIDNRCKSRFPAIDGVPILINDSTSVFSIKQFVDKENKLQKLDNKSMIYKLWQILPKPEISANIKAKINYPKFAKLLTNSTPNPKVLILGSGEIGAGLKTIINDPSIEFIETDVGLASRVVVVCDAHELPFSNETFDGVIIQAVLEHTCDPYQCVKEICRVLKPDGLVYAETPFMQQVHIGRYDFTRFTHLGHLRLFRQFDVIDDGAVCGTGMALAWSYQGFLLSFVKSKWARALITLFTCYTAFWLKYFDYFLIDKPGTLDAASGYYLLGRKSQKTLSDKQLINLYRGIQQ